MEQFAEKFAQNFIEDNRWQYLLNGLGVTLQVTFFALIIGIVVGFIIAAVRSTCELNGSLKVPNFICKIYITIIRVPRLLFSFLLFIT